MKKPSAISCRSDKHAMYATSGRCKQMWIMTEQQIQPNGLKFASSLKKQKSKRIWHYNLQIQTSRPK